MYIMHLTAYFLLLLPAVFSTSTHTYQGTVLGHDERCQSLCLTVCDSADCVAACNAKFCVFEESEESVWMYAGVMLVVVGVMALVLRWVLRKMMAQREMGMDEESPRYYHSL